MTSVAKLVLAGFVLAAGVAYAQVEATDPNVIERKAQMRVQGGAAKALGDIAKGTVAYDAAAAEAAKAALVEASMQTEAHFKVNATDPASEAKPEIWTNWEDFLVKANALTEAANAIDTSSPETIGASMGAVGTACGSCHKAYRM